MLGANEGVQGSAAVMCLTMQEAAARRRLFEEGRDARLAARHDDVEEEWHVSMRLSKC